jgi:ribosomal protein S18 acetylase RimI-like enzyme
MMNPDNPIHQNLRYTLYEKADPAVRERIHGEIKAFNDVVSPHHRAARGAGLQALDVLATDVQGEIAGGLIADTYWGWLEIEDLWVAEKLRGHGIAQQLMRQAEAEARARGCTRVFLRTFSFQARGLYEKLGYHVVGELVDYPPGEVFYWMQKDLEI